MISAKPNNDRTLYALRDQAETQWDAVVAFKMIERSAQQDASKRWRDENEEKAKEQSRARAKRWRKLNLDGFAAAKAKRAEAEKAWRAANKEKQKAYRKKYRLSHVNEVRTQKQAWNAANRDKIAVYRQRQKEKNGV